jgi:hypothetical protein
MGKSPVTCPHCKREHMVQHCPPSNRCRWLLCGLCYTRWDPKTNRMFRTPQVEQEAS